MAAVIKLMHFIAAKTFKVSSFSLVVIGLQITSRSSFRIRGLTRLVFSSQSHLETPARVLIQISIATRTQVVFGIPDWSGVALHCSAYAMFR